MKNAREQKNSATKVIATCELAQVRGGAKINTWLSETDRNNLLAQGKLHLYTTF
jgi:hypothetical protein